jgi:hypothetical protein
LIPTVAVVNLPKKNRQTPRCAGLAVLAVRAFAFCESGNLKIQTCGLATAANARRKCIHKTVHHARNRNKEKMAVNANCKICAI